MKTLTYLVFATLTFTAVAHADPAADLSANLNEKLNAQFSQMSSELTAQMQLSLENRLAQMIQQFETTDETINAESGPVMLTEYAAIRVTATQSKTTGSVQ